MCCHRSRPGGILTLVPKHRKQHVIPKCYLRAWCDPLTPRGQAPYLWRITRDGSKKQKRSPEKSFTAADRYTIKLPNGGRDLIIEETLSKLESDFVRVLARVRRREPLEPKDRARLCVFAAAMHARPIAMGEHWRSTMQSVKANVARLEQAHGAEPSASRDLEPLVATAPQMFLAESLGFQPPLLFQMAMSVMVTDDEVGFITSDTPCVWLNPEAYKMPPIYRSPGLAQRGIEVRLPLTPQHLLIISHHDKIPQYAEVGQAAVDEFNRITRFNCHEEFTSWKGATRLCWFDPGKPPPDAWENSPEGKAALERPR